MQSWGPARRLLRELLSVLSVHSDPSQVPAL